MIARKLLKPYASLLDCKIRKCISIESLKCKSFSDSARYLPVGNMQSYGEICLPGEGSAAIFSKNQRKININHEQMIVTVSSNVTVGELMLHLERDGYYIRVYPGGNNVTVGGCVAADVHGKSSHKYGTFGNQLENILIYDLKSSTKMLINKDDVLFRYTVSGFGATGIILEANIKIFKIPGKSLYVDSVKVKLESELIGKLIKICDSSDDVAAWFSVQGDTFYSKIIFAKWCQSESLERRNFLKYLYPVAFSVLGLTLLNKIAYRLLAVYIHNKSESGYLTQFQTTFPLNEVTGWKFIYGLKFIERQFLVDFDSANAFFEELLGLMRSHKINSPFCAIKIFNGDRVGLMSFARAGVSFNILHRGSELEFSKALSILLDKYQAPEYLAKSSKSSSTFPKYYDNYDAWIKLMRKNNVSSLYFD